MNDIEPIKDGFHPRLEEWIYRKDPAIAISDLKEMRYSPAHFYSKKFGSQPYRKQSEDLEFGSLLHMSVLEPERFEKDVILPPTDAPKKPTKVQREAKKPSQETLDAIAFWDSWDKENANKQVIDPELMARVKGCRDSIMAHPDASALINGSVMELSMFLTREVNGHPVRVKGRADIIRADAGIIADIKTVDRGMANSFDFSYAIRKWGYHLQAAWYLDLYNAAFDKVEPFEEPPSMRSWIFIVAEKHPPFDVVTMELDPGSIEIGRSDYRGHLNTAAHCLKHGEWPGSPQVRGFVSLPRKGGDW